MDFIESELFSKANPPRQIPKPAMAPAPWKRIIAMAMAMFLTQWVDPSLKSIPMVTAGLKCAPLIGPNIYAHMNTVRPTH